MNARSARMQMLMKESKEYEEFKERSQEDQGYSTRWEKATALKNQKSVVSRSVISGECDRDARSSVTDY